MKRLKSWYRRLVPLRPHDTTARVVLERTLDKMEHIENVIVVIHWKGGTIDCDWSNLMKSDFALSAIAVNEQARQICLRKD